MRRRPMFNNKKRFSATEGAVVAVYARSLTTERQPDFFQSVACLQSTIHENLLAQTKSLFERKKVRDKQKKITLASIVDKSSKPKNLECSFKDGQP